MTPEYIALKLSLLPQFEVANVDPVTVKFGSGFTLRGTFSESVPEEGGASLFLPDLRYLFSGSMLPATSLLREIEFPDRTDFEVNLAEIIGKKLAYFGASYDRRHVSLALDPEIEWEEVHFQPHLALAEHYIDKEGKEWTKRSEFVEGTEVPKGAWLEEGGWDHEHCVFCWNTIDAEHTGYKSQHGTYEGEWVCKWCYENTIKNHDPRPLISDYKDRK